MRRCPRKPILILTTALLAPLACAKQPAATAEPPPEPAAQAEPEAKPGPALWVARDVDTTVYLFGTVHILPPEVEWRTPTIDAAFDEAAVVLFEADVSSPLVQAKMIALMPELGMYDEGRTLSQALGPDKLAQVGEAAEQLGAPMTALEPMRPWLAAISIESQSVMARGYDPQSGVETVLGDAAEQAGKQLRYFETAEQQLRFFAELPEAEQVNFLVETAKTVVEEPEAIDELVGAWAVGDVAKLEALVYDDASMGSDAVIEALLRNRNRDWTGQLRALMDAEPGVFFVAVGAAHLIGEDGVPTLLRDAGVSVEGP